MTRQERQRIERLAARYLATDNPREARKISSQIFDEVHRHSGGHYGARIGAHTDQTSKNQRFE